jgi:hypothetical protein
MIKAKIVFDNARAFAMLNGLPFFYYKDQLAIVSLYSSIQKNK